MRPKPVIPRERARKDIDDALDHCLQTFDQSAAFAFIEALEDALETVGRFPSAGSSRYAHELALPDLRCWSIRGHPVVLFYLEHETHIDLWRALHAQRDIPATLRDLSLD